jgi:hypothetical protein
MFRFRDLKLETWNFAREMRKDGFSHHFVTKSCYKPFQTQFFSDFQKDNKHNVIFQRFFDFWNSERFSEIQASFLGQSMNYSRKRVYTVFARFVLKAFNKFVARMWRAFPDQRRLSPFDHFFWGYRKFLTLVSARAIQYLRRHVDVLQLAWEIRNSQDTIDVLLVSWCWNPFSGAIL